MYKQDIIKNEIKQITCWGELNKGSESRDFSELEKALDEGWEIIGQYVFTFVLRRTYNGNKL